MDLVIPGRKDLSISAVVLDYNGTIAVDGKLCPAFAPRIEKLAESVDVYVLTADTFGTVQRECEDLPLTVEVFPSGEASQAKRDVVRRLKGGVCCIGNGFNDRLMFEEADLAIAVLGPEGLSSAALVSADIMASRIEDALDLLLYPKRLAATLRA